MTMKLILPAATAVLLLGCSSIKPISGHIDNKEEFEYSIGDVLPTSMEKTLDEETLYRIGIAKQRLDYEIESLFAREATKKKQEGIVGIYSNAQGEKR